MFLAFNFLCVQYYNMEKFRYVTVLVPRHILYSSRREQTLIMIKDNNYPVIDDVAMSVKSKLKI